MSRPAEGAKLWAGLQAGDTPVAAQLDRMFRSASDCLAVVEAFKSRGVSLFLLDLNCGADDVSGNGIARLFRLGLPRVRAQPDRRAHPCDQASAEGQCEFSGGSVPFGFTIGPNRQLVPVKEQQAAKRYALHAKGHSLRAISAELAKEGPSCRMLPWDAC